MTLEVPQNLRNGGFKELLLNAVEAGASDVSLQSKLPAWVEVEGRWTACGPRPITHDELESIISSEYGAAGLSQYKGGADLDFAVQFTDGRHKRRFRCNATPILGGAGDGLQITARLIDPDPPTLEAIGFEQALAKRIKTKSGLILVSGATGDGKSSTLAGLIRFWMEDNSSNGQKILTYESPIEFVYGGVKSDHSFVSQSEIPRHLKSFEAGVRNALRRKPNIIVVGETRDRDTIEACTEACLTGHLVLSTVHASSAAETIRRIISRFSEEERVGKSYDVLRSLNAIIAQKLVRLKNGKRRALREIIEFTPEDKTRLYQCKTEQWAEEIDEIVINRGGGFREQAKALIDEGLLDQAVGQEIGVSSEEAPNGLA